MGGFYVAVCVTLRCFRVPACVRRGSVRVDTMRCTEDSLSVMTSTTHGLLDQLKNVEAFKERIE